MHCSTHKTRTTTTRIKNVALSNQYTWGPSPTPHPIKIPLNTPLSSPTPTQNKTKEQRAQPAHQSYFCVFLDFFLKKCAKLRKVITRCWVLCKFSCTYRLVGGKTRRSSLWIKSHLILDGGYWLGVRVLCCAQQSGPYSMIFVVWCGRLRKNYCRGVEKLLKMFLLF